MYRTLAFALLLSVTPALAQQTPNPYEDKGWALLFGLDNADARFFGGGDLLGSFSGGTASLVYQTSPQSAWRVSLGFRAFTDDTEEASRTEQRQTNSDTDSNGNPFFTETSTRLIDLDEASSGGTVRLSPHYLRRFPTGRPLTLFVTGGPLLDLTRQTSETVRTNAFEGQTTSAFTTEPRIDRFTGTETVRTERDVTGWGVGAGASVGAEWFVTSHISLTAEYRVFGGYSRNTTDRTEISTSMRQTVSDVGGDFERRSTQQQTTTTADDVVDSGWGLSNPVARFGLALYL